ncbi:hypothetical protein P7C70_g8790, partial [Phenoliferia sp. Uapishka_3]
MLIPIRLRASVFALVYLTCTPALATPLPPDTINILPSEFILAPIYTPPSTSSSPSPSGLVTDSHIIRDSYLIILHDHLESHHIEQHHQLVEKIHKADKRLRVLKDTAGEELEGLVHRFSVGKKSEGKKLKGYSGKFSESTLDAIRALPEVKYVERDSIVWASEVEKGAPWGLARISHRNPLSFGTFNRYEFDGQGGEGVDAYVIDT